MTDDPGAAGRLVAWTLAAVASGVVLTAAWAATSGVEGAWRAWAAGAGSGVAATVLTLPLLLSSLRLPPTAAGPRVMAAGLVRVLVTLASAGALVAAFDAPRRPAAVIALVVYGLALYAETWHAASAVARQQAQPSSPDR